MLMCVASCEKSTGELKIKHTHRAATARYLSQDRERKRSEKPGKEMVLRPKRKGKGVGYARGRY
jgi:hypothetical protein